MALAVVVDGKAVEVTEPRVCRMILALLHIADDIKRLREGDVQLHFGDGNRGVHAKLIRSVRVR